MQTEIKSLIFSKNRAIQLLALLESMQKHCLDFKEEDIQILFKVTTDQHRKQYENIHSLYPGIVFCEEQHIAEDVLRIIRQPNHILFLCDDSIFVRSFWISDVIKLLEENPDCIGFSLRLGRNITYSYPHDRKQDTISFEEVKEKILKLNWTQYTCDFGYPMEISSSLYRSSDLLMLSKGADFHTLHHVESSLNCRKEQLKRQRPNLLCFETSRAFSNPMNLTSSYSQNRVSKNEEFSLQRMADKFDEGYKIDISIFDNFTPSSCHQEVPFSWIGR